jgi:hypothetical protein
MRQFVFIFCFLSSLLSCYGQSFNDVKMKEKFVFHQLDFLETGTDKLLYSPDNIKGLIVTSSYDNKEYLTISIPGVHTYYLHIINKVVDTPEPDMKVIMYQGGETIENVGTYVANVFFVYDLQKNTSIPEFVRLELHNSPNILMFSGLIKLTD